MKEHVSFDVFVGGYIALVVFFFFATFFRYIFIVEKEDVGGIIGHSFWLALFYAVAWPLWIIALPVIWLVHFIIPNKDGA